MFLALISLIFLDTDMDSHLNSQNCAFRSILTIRFGSLRYVFVEFSCRRHSPVTAFKFIDCLTKDDTNHYSKTLRVPNCEFFQAQWNGNWGHSSSMVIFRIEAYT